MYCMSYKITVSAQFMRCIIRLTVCCLVPMPWCIIDSALHFFLIHLLWSKIIHVYTCVSLTSSLLSPSSWHCAPTWSSLSLFLPVSTGRAPYWANSLAEHQCQSSHLFVTHLLLLEPEFPALCPHLVQPLLVPASQHQAGTMLGKQSGCGSTNARARTCPFL